ncbi:ABC transporter substrate-binding protein [Phreatobacter cathodiphilus]|uniref:ABC transporter substrate-binding protein n=1 Tax=Phreatobacter cathodiphilus TaxID=1868589 RepID=A0A2S0NC65_9HYPH|nr:ABC transporter substrate-binding protein [Phreatobacter cathodiphilus]AVO45759.1 ABC transporter substrate-binding protein [Phreatobacter cathodiphilus]
MTTRRGFLAGMATALSIPAVGRAQGASVLKFAPQSDVAILDPIMSVSYVTRNHAFLIFDTLYGADENNRAQPQMVEGHRVERDGLEWTLTLREGLRFHDGSPVLARDVVASIQRWWKRDNVGQVLAGITDELSAVSDRAVRFRLKVPFPMLPDALGKFGTNNAVIMPERLARTEATVQVTEMVGSGPYRFLPQERVPGSRLVYEKFGGYVPRAGGQTSALAGPKVAHFDRVEWHVMPDVATAAAALQKGEIDWWEQPASDYWKLLAGNRNIKLDQIDTFGSAGVIRFNFLQAPTSNVLIRRAALAAISQRDVMTAVIGEEKDRWRDKVGFFLPGTPMASTVGIDALKEPPDPATARRLLAEAGYKGEPLVFLVPGDIATIKTQGEVVTDALQKAGFTIDMQVMDWGTVLARANNRQEASKGGWHLIGTFTAGVGLLNPSSNNFLRGSGTSAIFGWSDIPKLEELRSAWFRAPTVEAQAAICAEIQRVAFDTLPYAPTGLYFQQTAYRSNLTGVQKGLPLFYGVRRT